MHTFKEHKGPGWIGVDLDSTLAVYEHWVAEDEIGEPVPKMMARVKRWIADGRWIKIFTARADSPKAVAAIKIWLEKNGLPPLEITNVKDYLMDELWDDRVVAVERNTGVALSPSRRGLE